MAGKQTSTYVGIYTEELYDRLLRNAREVREIRKELRSIEKQLVAAGYSENEEIILDATLFIPQLLERFQIEYTKRDRSGVYGFTQRLMAYNSNKIEGSTLTEEQTASLFDTGVLPRSDDYYRAKDVEEMNGHFLMFNKMLDTLHQPLSQKLIKQFHYELKSGVFEDRANGYAIGDYKKRPNMIGINKTVLPSDVPQEMEKLLSWYNTQNITLNTLAEFHTRYEIIHPFQDGNGRIGRMILFRECLCHEITPFIIEDANRPEYLEALRTYRSTGSISELVTLFEKEQEYYKKQCEYFF